MALPSKFTPARRLRDARGTLTLQAFVAELKKKNRSLQLQPSTLFKYEQGRNRIPEEVLAAAAAISKIDFQKPTAAGVAIRLVISPLLDSAFLKFVSEPGVLDDLTEEELPTLNAKFIEAPYGGDLEKLSNAEADICLHNFVNARLFFDSHQSNCKSLGAGLLYRGYAVLVAGGETPRRFPFARSGLHPSELRDTSTQQNIDDWLEMTFTNRVTNPRWLVAANTDMQEISLRILTLLIQYSQSKFDHITGMLSKLKDSASESKLNETSAFSEFTTAIINHDPSAFFLGGLAQRLAAEDQGASLLLDHDDLLSLAPSADSAFREMLSPTNHIWATNNFIDKDADSIKDLLYRWEVAVRWVSNRRRTFKLIDAYIQEQLRYAQEAVEPESFKTRGWKPTADYFSLAIHRQLIELTPSPSRE